MRAFSWFVLPQFGAELRAPALHRLLAMLAHHDGRILNVAELSTALNVAQATVRRYLDLLEQLFLIRQLRPWHENLRERQVKRPKLYIRDPGLEQLLETIALAVPQAPVLLRGPPFDQALQLKKPVQIRADVRHGPEAAATQARRERR